MRTRTQRGCVLAVVLTGCAGSGHWEPPEPPADVVVMRPHWDQVCRTDERLPLLRRPEEVLRIDEASTGEAPGGLPEVLDPLLPPAPGGESRPFVDIAVNYDRSGALRTAHLLQHNVREAEARKVAEAVTPAVRSQVRILAPTLLRVRVIRDPSVRFQVLPALACMPHVAHEEEEPPRFLGGARVVGGSRTIPRFMDDGGAISVRVEVSESGVVEAVVPLAGNQELLARVREVVAAVEFDPALMNGEPVPGTMDLTFRFPE